MTPLSSALAARNQLDQDIALTLSAAQWEWRQLTPYLEQSWNMVGPRLTAVVTAGQLRTASRAPADVAEMLDQQGISPAADGIVSARALAGVASDGRPLESLLYQGLVLTGQALNSGNLFGQAISQGWDFIEQAVASEVADANRVAASVQSVLTPKVIAGHRVVNPGACSRCVVLAGIATWTLEPFARHPKCRCINVPSDEVDPEGVGTDPMDYFNSLSAKEQDRAFTIAGAQAIRDGANMNQVVNARRGMTTTVDAAQKRLIRDQWGKYSTTEGMTRRGWAHTVMSQNPRWTAEAGGKTYVKNTRLMPESIYELARNRDDAIRLLKAYGYF